MPYIEGRRVSNQEWQDRYSTLTHLHTGPGGSNPAPSGEVGDATAPKGEPMSAGGRRGARSTKAATAAVANALGVKANDPSLEGIDLSGYDADADDGSSPTDDGDQADDTAATHPADQEEDS